MGMSTDARTIASQCPDLPDGVVEKHLARLPADYVEKFPPEALAAHLRALSRLSNDHPVEVLVEQLQLQ